MSQMRFPGRVERALAAERAKPQPADPRPLWEQREEVERTRARAQPSACERGLCRYMDPKAEGPRGPSGVGICDGWRRTIKSGGAVVIAGPCARRKAWEDARSSAKAATTKGVGDSWR